MAGPLRYTRRAEVKVLEEASPVTPTGSLRMLSAAFEVGAAEWGQAGG